MGGRKPKYYNLQPKPNKATNFQNIRFQKKGISPHATRINKLQTTWLGGRKILHRGSIFFETVAYNECLKSFVDFLEEISSLNVPAVPSSSINVVLIGHDSDTFDTPVLLRTILRCFPELIQRMKDLNINFADSLVLFRNLVKDEREALKAADGSCASISTKQLYTNTFLTVISTATIQLKM